MVRDCDFEAREASRRRGEKGEIGLEVGGGCEPSSTVGLHVLKPNLCTVPPGTDIAVSIRCQLEILVC